MFERTPKQRQALQMLAGPETHCMLYGGSRSGKTFQICDAIAARAIKAPGSRHAALRFRFNHIKASVVMDTWPKVMALCWPGVDYRIDKTDFYARLGNGSQVWFGGLDEKERVERILGQEYATVFLNECSQISYDARNTAMTRLAQNVTAQIDGREERPLKLKMYYDCNPPSQAHWSYQVFELHRDPETKRMLPDPADYCSMQMNPKDNEANLPAGYIDKTLASLPHRLRRRFLEGLYADATPNALWEAADIDKWRVIDGGVPDLQRIVIAVDPSGASDADNAENDEIGIVVAALGTDGNAYVLEDLTVKAGPTTWGKVAVDAYERHGADCIVGESNFGGGMVEFVIHAARPRTPYKAVTASRGKVIRAEPVSVLAAQGKVRHVGEFRALEDELCAFTTFGYTGERSPNRADALVWAVSELFPALIAPPKEKKKAKRRPRQAQAHGWMAA